MAKYSMEDIDILRRKSGISYEEAVNLLEYHNGSLAQALLDLEKNGRISPEANSRAAHKGIKGVIHYLYCLRMVVKKEQTTVLNMSMLFLLLVLFTASHIAIIGVLLALALGYRISFTPNSRAFQDADFDQVVQNAKTNVKQSFDSLTKQFVRHEEAKAQPGPQAHAQSAASGKRPVNVQFPDEGSVDVRDGGDGYHEADIR